jgi:ethanolamine ammonia-lyase large subunit
VDHDITRVIAGIADTALKPEQAAVDTLNLLRDLVR